jgi:hypothetical protein
VRSDGGNTPVLSAKADGNVGIGTFSPARKISIYDGVLPAIALQTSSTGTTSGDGFQVQMSGTEAYLWNYENSRIYLGTNNSHVMQIGSNGRVGIGTGTTAPVEDLHIKGTNPRINVEGDGSSYYPSIRVTGLNGGISLGTYYGGNISGEHGIAFLTGSSATDSGTRRMVINGSGEVAIGDTNPTRHTQVTRTLIYNGSTTASHAALHCSRNGTGNEFQVAFSNAYGVRGTITTTSGAVSYNTTSDYRLKENVVELTGATDRIKQLEPKRFNFIVDPDKTVDGFIAHEAQSVVPEAVTGTHDAMRDEEYEVTPAVLDEDGNVVTEAVMGTRSVPDYQGIDQSKLVPLLTAALQEAITKIEDLEARVAALET